MSEQADIIPGATAGDPPYPQAVRLCLWPVHPDGATAGPANPQEHGFTGPASPYCRVQVPGRPAVVPPEQILQRVGLTIPGPPGQLDDPVRTVDTTLINLLRDHLLAHDIVQMDETTVQVLKEPGKTAQSKSYLWLQRGGPPDQPVILFDYDPRAPKRSRWHCWKALPATCRLMGTVVITVWLLRAA